MRPNQEVISGLTYILLERGFLFRVAVGWTAYLDSFTPGDANVEKSQRLLPCLPSRKTPPFAGNGHSSGG
jgi:hypothetical protein